MYDNLIRQLREAAAELLTAATALEKVQQPVPVSRRGRRGMGAEERKEVSARMKKYWASRRQAHA